MTGSTGTANRLPSPRGTVSLANDRRPSLWFLLLVPPVALLAFWNVAGLVHTLTLLPHAGQVSDPLYWRRVDLGDPYAWEWVRWSPPAVWLWHHAMGALPLVMLASLASLLLLPWRVALVALLLWPFWEGLIGGSIVVFVVVAAWNAREGKRWAIIAYVVIFALVPRPFMLPVLAVLLWRHPAARWALLAAILGVVGYSLAVGQLTDWLGSLSASVTQDTVNLSPAALVGPAWLLVGVPLGAWLTWKGWYGLAGLVISPYVLMSYLLILLLDLRQVVNQKAGWTVWSSHASAVTGPAGRGSADSSRP